MCDLCRSSRVEIEKMFVEIKERFPTMVEHHIQMTVAADASVNEHELRKAFTNVGPHFHAQMSLANVAIEELLNAFNGDVARTLASLLDLAQRKMSQQHQLLHMDSMGSKPS